MGENSHEVTAPPARAHGGDPGDPARGRRGHAGLRADRAGRPGARDRARRTCSRARSWSSPCSSSSSGNLRAGLIVAAAIPLSMLFAAQRHAALRHRRQPDEPRRHRLRPHRRQLGDHGREQRAPARRARPRAQSVLETVRDAAIEVRKPTMFGELIIAIVFLPILTLEGIEGKLFRPMALTVIFALAGSLILSLTLMPVLASLRPARRRPGHGRTALVRGSKRVYRPGRALRAARGAGWCSSAPWSCSSAARLLGDAHRVGVHPAALRGRHRHQHGAARPGSRSRSRCATARRSRRSSSRSSPTRSRDVWTRTGTAEVATDPMGIELSDVFITLAPAERVDAGRRPRTSWSSS